MLSGYKGAEADIAQQVEREPRQSGVGVVTVVHNAGDELRVFVETLAAATEHPYELAIINTGSGTVKCAGADILVDHPDGNVGYGNGINYGFDLLQEKMAGDGVSMEWLIVTNPDIEWSTLAIDKLIEAAESEPDAGAIGPKLLNEDGSTYPSARAQPSLSVGVGHALFTKFWPNNPWSRQYQHELSETEPTEVGWLSGACLLLRAEAFKQVDGFDKRYFMFFEDVDLGDRLLKAGWKNIYVPTVSVTHYQGTSWKSKPTAMIRAHHDSARLFLFDRWGAWWQAPIRLFVAIGLKVREHMEVADANRRGFGD